MNFLQSIVADYRKVKRAVFDRYSGIHSLKKPVFDIMTEMRHCGLREQLNLPSAYYETAVKEAAENIKGMWSFLKNRLRKFITANENLTEDDRFYLRYVLKADELYGAVLNRRDHQMPETLQTLDMDENRLDNLLRRLIRKYLVKPSVGTVIAFSVPTVGYSYKDGALRLASRTKQKRVVLPLRDNRTSRQQLRICERDNYAAIAIPVDVRKRRHADYQGTIYVHFGYRNICTLSSGAVYDEGLADRAYPYG